VAAGDAPVLVHNCDHVLLDINPDADKLAEKIGARTFNDPKYGATEGGTPLWQTGVLNAVGTPSTQLSVQLDGLHGDTADERFRLAYIAGVKAGKTKAAEVGSGLGTVWERSIVGKAAFLASMGETEGARPWHKVDFYHQGEQVFPDEPDWMELRGAAGQLDTGGGRRRR
jgi:hypothetical protein